MWGKLAVFKCKFVNGFKLVSNCFRVHRKRPGQANKSLVSNFKLKSLLEDAAFVSFIDNRINLLLESKLESKLGPFVKNTRHFFMPPGQESMAKRRKVTISDSKVYDVQDFGFPIFSDYIPLPPLPSQDLPPLALALPPLAQALPPLAQALPPLVQDLPPLAQALPPLAQALPPLAQALPPLAQALPQTLDHQTTYRTDCGFDFEKLMYSVFEKELLDRKLKQGVADFSEAIDDDLLLKYLSE
jgi:hypothetical protein